jgi:trk system potassium uptake protein
VYIVIAGCRKVGSNLALALSQEHHEVAVVDSDPDDFELLGSGFNGLTVTGMPIDEDVLRSAGIEHADALAAVSNDDNMNVMISQVASNIFQVPKVITRVYDPEREAVFNMMGITTLCPTTLAVQKIKDFLLAPEQNESLVIQGAGITFKHTKPGKSILGKTIGSIENGHILGVIRQGAFLLANPKTQVTEADTLVVAEYSEQG